MVQTDENRFTFAVKLSNQILSFGGIHFEFLLRGGDGELLFSSDYITSFKFDLSENSLSATVDTGEADEPVFVTDGDTDEH